MRAKEANDIVIVISPCGKLDPGQRIVAGAAAGGGLGVLDLGTGDHQAMLALRQAVKWSPGPIGVRVPALCRATMADVEKAAGGKVEVVVLEPDSPWSVAEAAQRYRTLVEVTSLAEARQAADSGADGLIARGMEAGGRVGELSSFVLTQQLAGGASPGLPVWVCGGIGPRTAAACVVGGAHGVVLDNQLALMPESDLPDIAMASIRRMDGSETVLIGGFRGVRPLGSRGVLEDEAASLLPVGQDGWLAAVFASRWPDTAAAVRGIRAAIADVLADTQAADLLSPGSPLATALGVRIPVAQGPMTRVSDEAAFAAAVASEGAMPFLALALADAQQCRRMLSEAAAVLGDRPWGVGILGFVPDELRTAQIEVVREFRPSCAIIAGGRPAQAKALEAEGIGTYLHVPSPGLLRQFLRAGARKFVFEGAECGGHVGPRASFPLWEAQIAAIEEYLDEDPAAAEQIHVFFAGGIHDTRSAAMVTAMAAVPARRGVRIGVLMGTAYLFTREAVENGAIQPGFQAEALAATGTALLQTAPGHATRCLHSPFVDDFHHLQAELEAAGVDSRQVWEQLETLNVGRLRIASKGLRRDGAEIVAVDEATQAAEGLFMAGQVAVLRDSRTTLASLHAEVTTRAREFHLERLRSLGALEPVPSKEKEPPLDIAIIGMSCVFPGSPDLASFWQTILSGHDAVTEVPPQRWDPDVYYAPEVGPGQAGRVSVSRWGGFLDEVPFDAIRYGIPPSALSAIDPTQLLALEVSHRALVDAGYPHDRPGADHSRTGVVFGAEAGSDMGHAQTLRTMLPAYLGEVPAELDDLLPRVTEDSFPGVLANVIAGRVANRLDLSGPNFTVDAACASSLAAMDAACKELTAGTSDLMLCGGADLHNGVNDFLMFTSAHALSPTGRCRPFDAMGDGIALGEGVACLVLKRLADARRDGDRIYAVIKGVGAASDGRALGLTAPRTDGQRRALDRAYDRAGISPRQVRLVEAHGTGTAVGDRTELETLTRLFTEAGAEPGGCVLGSVKSQIGHTKCAAGLAGMLKAALSLHHGVIPPTINLKQPNPAWDSRHSPFVFHTESSPWLAPASERIAGISAFGFGGTNYHVVLEAYDASPQGRHARDHWPAELFCFRAVDREAAHQDVRQLLSILDRDDRRIRLRDLAATVARESAGRRGQVRVAVVARDVGELHTLLRRALAGEHDPRGGLIQPSTALAQDPAKVAFLFPGQGSQRVGALAELFVAFPELRHYLDLGREWTDLLFPPTAFTPQAKGEQEDRLRDTRAAQPVLGIGGLAVHHLLGRLGVRPDMAGGHSYGELVALCAAGSFDAAELLDLSRERAAAILAAAGEDPGTMAAVGAAARRVEEVLAKAGLSDTVVIANHNSPVQVVISGPTQAVQTAGTALKDAGVSVRGLTVACAFHSPVVADAAQRFSEHLGGRDVSAPAIPVWSNHTAQPYEENPDGVRRTLAEQIRRPVRFVDQIEAMYAAGARVFVEAGPGQVLTKLVQAVLGDRPHLAVACDDPRGDGLRAFLTAVGELACAGLPVQTGWLFRGRDTVDVADAKPQRNPLWTVDGQLVRDSSGNCLPGGMKPPKRIKELSMTLTNGPAVNGRDGRDELLSEFLRTGREMIAAQRDVMLAYFGGGGGRFTWQPVEGYEAPPLQVAAVATAPPPPMAPVVGQLLEPQVAELAVVEPQLDFQGAVLVVISERTGYPIDLIDLDLDLEADLSIDSIKRAEVAGEVATRLRLPTDGDQSELEDLVKARTVRAMVQWLTEKVGGAVAMDPVPVALASAPLALEPAPVALMSAVALTSAPAVAVAVAAESNGSAVGATAVAGNGSAPAVLVAGNGSAPAVLVAGNGLALAAGAMGTEGPHGIAPVRMVAKEVALPDADEQNLSTLDGLSFMVAGDCPVAASLAGLLRENGATVHSGSLESAGLPAVDGLIITSALAPDQGPVLPQAISAIKQALAGGARWLLAVTGHEGDPAGDGLRGLFRTISREYPDVNARVVALGSHPEPDELARHLLTELVAKDRAPVVYRDGGARRTLDLVAQPLGPLATGGAGPAGDGTAEAQAVGLGRDSVVVLFGGARGITPWTARALASASGCHIELVGRTPLPEGPEEPEIAAAADKAAICAVLARQGMKSPAEIDRRARALLAGREVAATVRELRELGGQVRYHALDVLDATATSRLVKQIHGEHGRIDGIVYAAGIIEDKLLADKDVESFQRVFRTKVDGARAVLAALGEVPSAPGFVVLFGSIAAAYGNRGQADYAAANDALESLGARWAGNTGVRCLTVHWGPWAPAAGHQGMVTAELGREYARRGIEMIDPEEGALTLLRELAYGDPGVRSVVYTASGW